MPRPRSNHHLHGNNLPQPQPTHQTPTMYQQQRSDPQVQRSQGVIFLSTNKPAAPPAQPPPTPSSHLAHQVNQVPAHHASMFQSQHMPAFVPTSIMQNPFFPYYHPMTHPVAPSSNDIYTPNGGGVGGVPYDQSMQVPPSPIRQKSKRRSRYTADDSDSSSEAEINDDEEDPDWDPTGAGDEAPEPTFENRRGGGAPRGRRVSTTPRGRGRGRGSCGGGRGRGRGRGRVSDVGMTRADNPPSLVDQSSHMQNNMAGRQTRSTYSMPSLDPQTGQLTFGELVSAAVQSLNDPDDDYSSGRSPHKRQKQIMAAVIISQPDKTILVEPVPVSKPANLFVPVDVSEQPREQENKDELALEAEDEDLIMAYEIVQDEDKQRPFLCEICGKESRSRVLHNRHLVKHAPTLRFACCICSQLFESHEKLKPHLRMHHGTGIFVCPELDCEGVFQERKSLDDHDFACHPNARPFVCRFCLDRFPSVADANAHEDAHEEDITASCMKCSATYKTKTDLKNHYSHMHEEKQCKFCENKLENQPALDDHMNEVHPEKLRPPTPPPPSPPADDDPMPSPPGGNDDDDDIVVVEERKKVTSAKPTKKPEIKKTPKRPEPKTILKPGPKPGPSPRPKPAVTFKKPIATSGDIITLSSDSDDDKDPEWAPEGIGKQSRRSFPSSPIKRSTRNKPEYVIVVESRTEETANDVLKKTSKSSNQPLTFVMGDSGDLVHVPTSSDPHPPDSLPLKEIMKAIKSKKLSDNTTIIIEDNKISSIKPTSAERSTKSLPPARTSLSATKDVSVKSRVRPSTESAESSRIKPSTSADSRPSSSDKTKLVAKKRTGGLPRSDKHESRHRTYELPSTSEKAKPATPGPIARKRTGGSSSIYDSMKHKADKHEDDDIAKVKHPRKEAHSLREDFDEPLIVEARVASHKPVSSAVKLPISSSSHKHKKNKRGRKKGHSKSQRRQEKEKRQLEAEQAVDEITDYDSAPKRSLRIALKASVTDATGEDSPSSAVEMEDPIADDGYLPIDPMPTTHKRRGRPSTKPVPIDAPAVNNSNNNSLGESSTSSASNGQVVMKALVNGKWQDVVIGTKLTTDPDPLQTSASKPIPSTSRMEKAPRQVNAKKSTGGNRRPPPPPATKITSGSRGGRRGRKGKNSKQSADCWNDDRYQYFSDGSRTLGTLNPSQMYAVPDTMSYKEDTGGDYDGINQEYGTDDTVLPFSLSSYMSYHQDQSPQTEEPEPEPEDHGLPVIVSAYHVDERNEVDNYEESYAGNDQDVYKEPSNSIDQEADEAEEIDEIPLRDPLAMDDGPSEEAVDEDPLGGSEHDAHSLQPVVVAEPKKGTAQEAKSAISNLRSVLSMITFKR